MKKFIGILLALILVFSFAACGKRNIDEDAKTSTTENTETLENKEIATPEPAQEATENPIQETEAPVEETNLAVSADTLVGKWIIERDAQELFKESIMDEADETDEDLIAVFTQTFNSLKQLRIVMTLEVKNDLNAIIRFSVNEEDAVSFSNALKDAMREYASSMLEKLAEENGMSVEEALTSTGYDSKEAFIEMEPMLFKIDGDKVYIDEEMYVIPEIKPSSLTIKEFYANGTPVNDISSLINASDDGDEYGKFVAEFFVLPMNFTKGK